MDKITMDAIPFDYFQRLGALTSKMIGTWCSSVPGQDS